MKRNVILAILLATLCLVATACSPDTSSVETTTSTSVTYEEDDLSDDLSALAISWEEAEKVARKWKGFVLVCLKRDDKLYALNFLPETYIENIDIADFGMVIPRYESKMYYEYGKPVGYRNELVGQYILISDDDVRFGDAPIPTFKKGDTLMLYWSHGWDVNTDTIKVYSVNSAYSTVRCLFLNDSVFLFNQETKTTVELNGVSLNELSLIGNDGKTYQFSEGLESGESYEVLLPNGERMLMVADATRYRHSDIFFEVKQIKDKDAMWWEEFDISTLPSGTYSVWGVLFNIK